MEWSGLNGLEAFDCDRVDGPALDIEFDDALVAVLTVVALGVVALWRRW
jgi:hypothetical protein